MCGYDLHFLSLCLFLPSLTSLQNILVSCWYFILSLSFPGNVDVQHCLFFFFLTHYLFNKYIRHMAIFHNDLFYISYLFWWFWWFYLCTFSEVRFLLVIKYFLYTMWTLHQPLCIMCCITLLNVKSGASSVLCMCTYCERGGGNEEVSQLKVLKKLNCKSTSVCICKNSYVKQGDGENISETMF